MASQKLKMSTTIPTQVILAEGLKSGERSTLVAIHALARPEDGFAEVTAQSLESVLGATHWSIRKHIRDLESMGFLKRDCQFEHGPVIGACPWPKCYGVYVALRPTGKPYAWAEGLPVGNADWKADVEQQLSCG